MHKIAVNKHPASNNIADKGPKTATTTKLILIKLEALLPCDDCNIGRFVFFVEKKSNPVEINCF